MSIKQRRFLPVAHLPQQMYSWLVVRSPKWSAVKPLLVRKEWDGSQRIWWLVLGGKDHWQATQLRGWNGWHTKWMWQGDYMLSSNPSRWGHEKAHPRKYITFPWMRVLTSCGFSSLGDLECRLKCRIAIQKESTARIASKVRQETHVWSYAGLSLEVT